MCRPQFLLYLVVAVFLLGGCQGLKRGIDGSALVSTAQPDISVSVSSLPLRTGGEFTAAITTDSSLGGISVPSWLAVYGGETPTAPMAIVAYAVAPEPWYWDSELAPLFSISKGVVMLGTVGFQSATYRVSGARDAFAPLVPVEDPDSLQWIARRFARRDDFNQVKITLEYREPLPENFLSQGGVITFEGRRFLEAFEQRSMQIFTIAAAPASAANLVPRYPEGLRLRYLDTNFFGTMSRIVAFD